VPATNALATGLTAITSFRSWKLEVDNKVDTGRWNLAASRAQPAMGMPDYKFSAKVELNATTIPAAMVAGTQNPWYTTYTTTETLERQRQQGAGRHPEAGDQQGGHRGEDRRPHDDHPRRHVTNDGTNADCYFVYRVTDTAL
jgi:hypothetical protein